MSFLAAPVLENLSFPCSRCWTVCSSQSRFWYSHRCLPANGPGLQQYGVGVEPQREQPEQRGEARALLSSPPPARLLRLQVEGCRAAGSMSVCGGLVAAGGPAALLESELKEFLLNLQDFT